MKIDKELVEKAVEGEKNAFETLYYSCYNDFYKFAFFILGNSEDAVDVVSDVFVDIISGIRKLRNPEAFSSWAFRILSARCKKEISKRVKYRSLFYPDDFSEIQSFCSEITKDDLSENAALSEAFSKLEAEERMIIILFVLHGYTHKEIAGILGKPEGTVKSRLYRAYAKLRRLMK